MADVRPDECIMNVAEDLQIDKTQEGLDWLENLRYTFDNLMKGRDRCLNMINERLQEICKAAWNAQVMYEAGRLTNELKEIVGIDNAQIFFEGFISCLGVQAPEERP